MDKNGGREGKVFWENDGYEGEGEKGGEKGVDKVMGGIEEMIGEMGE